MSVANNHIVECENNRAAATSADEELSYKKLYFGLFNGINLIIEKNSSRKQTIEALKQLQCKAEEFYVNSGFSGNIPDQFR